MRATLRRGAVRPWRRAALAVAAVVSLAAAASASDPRITRIDPPGAQRGGEVTFRLIGDRLHDQPQTLLLSEPGIELLRLERVDNKTVTARVRIAEDCPLGAHHLRLCTETGLSNLARVHIGALPELSEAEPNNTVERAQPIELGVVVNGVVQREDTDCFAVELTAGQRLSVEVEGLRLSSRALFDPALVVLGPGRNVIAKADDSQPTRQDPCVSLVAAEDGRYCILLREVALRGGGDHRYRMHVGSFARPMAVFPPVAEAGKPTEFRWLGPAAPAETFTATLEAGAEAGTDDGWHGKQLLPAPQERSEGGLGAAPTGLPVRVANRPVAVESEPNDTHQQATPFTGPAAVAGVLQRPGDRDFFRFAAKKNQTWNLRVWARKLASPADTVLRVLDARGKRLAGNDDDRGQSDSYIRFRAPADGDYVIEVAENLGRGGPTHVYAVEAAPVAPVVEMNLHEHQRYVSTTINVPRGNRTAVLINTRRVDFGGELECGFDGLPAGVSIDAAPVAGNYYRTPVVLSADASAEPAAALTRVTARRTGGGPLTARFKQQEWYVRGQNNFPTFSYFAHTAPVAVTTPAPFKIRLVEPQSPIVRDGSKNLRVIAERDEGFENPIRVQLMYHPPGLSSNRSRSITKDQSDVLIPATANGRAGLGDWRIVVIGEANHGGRLRVSTQLVTLTVAEPHLGLTLSKAAAQQGGEVDYRVGIEPRTAFEGEAKLQLLGLPPGVAAEPVQVAADATEAVFKLRLAADARLGRHRSLACRLTLTQAGEPVVHTRGGGELMIDPAPKALAGKPRGKRTAGRPAPGTRSSR
ncbi:MAG: PPC domain-containing protein [Planctomycetota bacterium]